MPDARQPKSLNHGRPRTGASRGVEEKLAERLSRRLIGTSMPTGTGWSADGIVSGPELVEPKAAEPRRSARAAPVREKMMDVAELLFARWGYTGVSVRDVTDLAGVRLGNVNYYFGSKQNLYFDVLRRRAEPLSTARVAALEKIEALDVPEPRFIQLVVDAYMDPALEFAINGGDGWRNFFQLIGHMTFSRLWPNALSQYFNVTALRYVDALRTRFPNASEFQLQSAVLMMVGPSLYTLARTGRVETFDAPAFSSDDLDILGPQVKDFICGGLEKLMIGG